MTSNRSGSRNVLFYAFLTVTAGSCDCGDDRPPDEVIVRSKPGIDFTQYQTFRIQGQLTQGQLVDAGVNPGNIPASARLNIDVANDQARIELLALGLREVATEQEAQLVVFSLGSTQDQGGIYWACVPGYWWGYWGYTWNTCAFLEPIYIEYTVGTVALGLADPKVQDVVFGGLLQGVADGSGDAEDRIRDGVHEMFKQYPTSPSK